MARKASSKRSKNSIQNVRMVDPAEGTDDIMCQRFLSAYNQSEGQIRVVCNTHTELATSATSITPGIIDFSNLAASDDFISISQQYTEFRVRSIRFDIYDINPSAVPVVNYWSTYHRVGGNVAVDIESVLDRPDSRAIAPGTGKDTLAWVAHSMPEMQFQSVDNYNGLGGLSYYLSQTTTAVNPKYTISAKFVVDFRARK